MHLVNLGDLFADSQKLHFLLYAFPRPPPMTGKQRDIESTTGSLTAPCFLVALTFTVAYNEDIFVNVDLPLRVHIQ